MEYERIEMPIEEPVPQACLRCGRALAVRRDRKTGKPVASDGRAMLQCPGCGSIEIGKDPVAWGRRFRIVRWLMVGSTAALFITETIREVLRVAAMAGDQVPHSAWKSMSWLAIGFAACACLHLMLTHMGHGLSPTQPMRERIDHWGLTAMYFGALVILAWGTLSILWPWLVPGR